MLQYKTPFCFISSSQIQSGRRRRVSGNGGSRLHAELLSTSHQTRVAQVQDLSKTLTYAPCSSLIPRASGTRSFCAGHLAKRGENSDKAGVRIPSPAFLSGVLGKAARSFLGTKEDWSISAQPLDRSNFRLTHLGVECVCECACVLTRVYARVCSGVQPVCPHTLDMRGGGGGGGCALKSHSLSPAAGT